MSQNSYPSFQYLLDTRYGDASPHADMGGAEGILRSMAARGSCRSFQDRAVPPDLLETLGAVALASPSKSDLQQRDIVFLASDASRRRLADIVGGQTWVSQAPMIAVFCGNNRRQRLLHEWRDVTFANDHLDAFFNAAVDAAIALGAFVTAAEAVGLGCCPISAIRNDAVAVSTLLGLPDHVFPVAGLAIGYPVETPEISKRLPLEQTLHTDRYQEGDLKAAVQGYDAKRAATQPYTQQRYPETFGTSDAYCWSEDKVRQYSRLERETFGEFIRTKGFRLD